MRTLETFYCSKEWRNLLAVIKQERTDAEGNIRCAYCGKPILKAYDIIGHHKTHLTEDNINDADIALNPDNVDLVHHRCHNEIHNKLGYSRKEIFIIYGPPLSGKRSFVQEAMQPGDLIIDIDSIWECISGQPRYTKPAKLNQIAFGVRDYLMDALHVRNGKWQTAYVIGGFPFQAERERILQYYGAREVFIVAPKEELIRRLHADPEGRSIDEYTKYINEWFLRSGTDPDNPSPPSDAAAV